MIISFLLFWLTAFVKQPVSSLNNLGWGGGWTMGFNETIWRQHSSACIWQLPGIYDQFEVYPLNYSTDFIQVYKPSGAKKWDTYTTIYNGDVDCSPVTFECVFYVINLRSLCYLLPPPVCKFHKDHVWEQRNIKERSSICACCSNGNSISVQSYPQPSVDWVRPRISNFS